MLDTQKGSKAFLEQVASEFEEFQRKKKKNCQARADAIQVSRKAKSNRICG
jgi:hypothetical protein